MQKWAAKSMLCILGILVIALPGLSLPQEEEKKPGEKKGEAGKEAQTTNLRIKVSAGNPPRPVVGVRVSVKSEEEDADYDVTAPTVSEGVARFDNVPRGKIKVQVIEDEWEHFGAYYQLRRDEETIKITLHKK